MLCPFCNRPIPKVRLTEEEKETVRCMKKNGIQVKTIATVYKINPATVWRICK